MIVIRICDSGKAKVANTEVAVGIQQEIWGFEVSMKHICRMNVLEAPQDLIGKVTNVIVAQFLRPQQLVKVAFHKGLDQVQVLQFVNAVFADDVLQVNDVFVLQPRQDLYLSKSSLAKCLMFERTYLLDCDAVVCNAVHR